MTDLFIPPNANTVDPLAGQSPTTSPASLSPSFTPVTGPLSPAQPSGSGVAGRVNSLLDVTSSPLNALTSALPGGDTSFPRINPTYQRNMTTLANKYTAMRDEITGLPDHVRNALVDLDSSRVANGAAPLTRKQTSLAIQTAMSNQPATPEASRNPFNVFGNFQHDASDILKAIPRLPLALYHEAQDLPHISQHITANEQAGMNPLAAILAAPGVRMVPGSFVLGGLAQGGKGIRNLATHPLMSALDVLPVAHEATGVTEVGRLEAAQAAELGTRPRPISAILANKVVDGIDAEGNPTRVMARNGLGQTKDFVQRETRIGQTLDATWGKDSRAMMRMLGGRIARYKSLLSGKGIGENELEDFMPDIAKTFEGYANTTTPLLAEKSVAGDTFRAQLKADIERGHNLDRYDPNLVADYKGLVDRIGTYAVNNGILARFDGEMYPTRVAKDLEERQGRVTASTVRQSARAEYLNPSGAATPDSLSRLADDALATSSTHRPRAATSVMHALDANGYETEAIRGAISAARKTGGDWGAVKTAFDDTLATETQGPRRSVTGIITELRRVNRADRQATRLEYALAQGDRPGVTAALKNLYARKPVAFPDEAWPAFREDVQSASRRMDFDIRNRGAALDNLIPRQQKLLDTALDRNPPARFHALLGDELSTRTTAEATSRRELALGRTLTPDEAAQVTSAVADRRWNMAFPDMDPEERQAFLRGMETDVARTWRDLRAAGEDPIFVHRVSTARTNAAVNGSIGPVPIAASQAKERALDLTPGVNDVQVSLTHQAGELLAERYRQQFADEMTDAFAKTEEQLREELAPTARWRMTLDPGMDFEGHLQETIRRGYEKFNPEQAGHAWGGVKLDKFGQQDIYIPKAIAENLKRLAKTPGIFSSAIDPFTKAFRYNVIGLSVGVIVNNFISHGVMVMAETGPGPLRYWGKAMDWLHDPASIDNEEIKSAILAEHPAMEPLNRDAWLKSRNGQRWIISQNAGHAFYDSAVAEGLKRGKSALDAIAEKSMRLQTTGMNVYRAMVYMDGVDKGLTDGLTREAAELRALQSVRRTLIDYNSFTPVERSAIRTIIPFYGFMGHAMRFISRYPLDHPWRAMLTAKLAAAEKERLGALPTSFLGMIPLTKRDSHGNQTFLPLAPFDAFGDISNLYSIGGWLAATNPVISAGLESVGLVRGETDAHPNLRYDPETGKMKPVTPGFLGQLFDNTLPRAGLITAALGVNKNYNELRGQDSGAASRYLLAAAGLPRWWRNENLDQERIKAEVNREVDASTVRNAALKSGDWAEAMRYPTLAAYFDQLRATSPAVLALNSPATKTAIADQLRTLIGAGG